MKNGKLAAGRLGRAATILGRRFGKGDQVFLDPSGRLAFGARSQQRQRITPPG
jgi:hypothetical protein